MVFQKFSAVIFYLSFSKKQIRKCLEDLLTFDEYRNKLLLIRTVQSGFILLKIYANTDIRLSATKVIVNGYLTESIPPERGVRQR